MIPDAKIPAGIKVCSACKVPKELAEFHKDRSKPDGLQTGCKLCKKAVTAKKGPDGLTNRQRRGRVIGSDGLTDSQRRERRIGLDGLTDQQRRDRKKGPDGLNSKQRWGNQKGPDGLTNEQRRGTKKGPDGLTSPQRWYRENSERTAALALKANYGLSVEQFDALLAEQGGTCAICNSLPAKGRLDVDHCHKTGEVRGLLCRSCNMGLGLLKDSGEFLVKAAGYLGYSYGAGILSADTLRRLKLVEPFIERTVVGGMSAGVSVAGYDVRIREGLTLKPGDFSLASTVERFTMPSGVLGTLFNKSTWARRGLYLFSTILEPSWEGVLTLELKNLGNEILTISEGMPIAQVCFHFTDQETKGYSGKYSNQEAGPQKARYE